jgi:hypothetical protein
MLAQNRVKASPLNAPDVVALAATVRGILALFLTMTAGTEAGFSRQIENHRRSGRTLAWIGLML